MALAIAGLLNGCSSSPSKPTLAPVTPLSDEQRDEAIARLNATLATNSLAQLTPDEPRTICSNFERTNWDLDRVIDPLLEAASDNVDAWRDYHNHVTLPAVLMGQMERRGFSFQEQVAQIGDWLRAFCASL